MIIGNLQTFGIELDFEHRTGRYMCPLRLFFDGNPLGVLEDHTLVPLFIGMFEQRLNDPLKLDGELINNTSAELVYNYIDHNIDEGNNNFRQCIFMPGDTFDDYSIYIYSYEESVFVTWKLIRKGTLFFHSEKEWVGAFMSKINVIEVKQCLQKLADLFDLDYISIYP